MAMRLGELLDLKKLSAEDDPVKKRLHVAGLDICIEAPKGSIRILKDDDGKVVYKKLMMADYGYIDGKKGRDGDSVDCFVGPMPHADEIYVVHMKDLGPDPKEREDEDKVMIGFPSADAAKAAFLAHYPESFYQSMTAMPMQEFLRRLEQTQIPHSHNMLHAKGTIAR
jgi:hypothetical protein